MKISVFTRLPRDGSPSFGVHLLAFMACLGGLPSVASAAVVAFTLPNPYRTSLEQPSAGPPGFYSAPGADAQSAYPIDFDGDGTPEFITDWDFQGIRLRPVCVENAVIATDFEQVGANLYILPLPSSVLIGIDPPGTNLRWGKPIAEPFPDIMGLGPVIGRYVMSFTSTGQGEGYWYRPWNKLLPEDWDYIGVRFQMEDGLHYGYLHYGYERSLGGITPSTYAVLRGWAWETEPGKSILIVPEPTAIWLVGGGFSLLAMRRRRIA